MYTYTQEQLHNPPSNNTVRNTLPAVMYTYIYGTKDYAINKIYHTRQPPTNPRVLAS